VGGKAAMAITSLDARTGRPVTDCRLNIVLFKETYIMASKKSVLTLALGSAFAAGLVSAPVANAASNPFALQSLDSGYMVAEHNDGHTKMQKEGKCGEGKCGEGKCGGKKDAKAMEGKCGGAKDAKAKEGKCGEGKCGGAKKMEEGKCGAKK
jgi:uncharacterized low-complexity protein